MHISMEKANGIVTTTKGLNLSGPLLTKNFDQMVNKLLPLNYLYLNSL